MQKYEKILQDEYRKPVRPPQMNLGETNSVNHQMSALTTEKMQLIDDARWRTKPGNRTVEIKPPADRIVRSSVFAKDLSRLQLARNHVQHWAGLEYRYCHYSC